MRKIKLFLSLLILATFGISNAWGATYSMTPNKAGTGLSNTAYITTLTEFTNNGVTWKMNQWNPSSLQIKTNQSSAASEWRFYNTTAMPGKITKVVIKFSALTLKSTSSTGFKFVGGSAAVTETTGGTDGVWDASAKTLTWTPSAGDEFTYFALYQNGKVATGTNNLASSDAIVVTYENTSSDETEVTDAQFAWSAASAEATLPSTFDNQPTLTNTLGLGVTYSSSTPATATIDATSGAITLKAAGTTTISAVFAGGEIEGVTYAAKTVSYTLTVKPAPLVIEPIEGGIIDILTHKTFAATSNSYTSFTGKQATNDNHSDAVYAGKTARNGSATQYNIQLNTIDKGRIATTTTGGLAKRVYVRWATQTTNTANRSLNIYGSNTAFTGNESTNPSTKIGTVTFTTGAAEAYVDLTGDYKYILITGSGAIYMDEIQVTWVSAAGTVVTPTISGETEFVESTEVSIATETGYKVYYTLDGTEPTNASTEYTAPFTVNATTTVKAVAYDGATASDVVSATFKALEILTCQAAKEKCAATESADKYVIRGYVTSIPYPYSATNTTPTFWMADTKDGGNVMQAYKVTPLEEADKAVIVGDQVEVIGKIKLYNETPEVNGGTYTITVPNPKYNVNITSAHGTVTATPASAVEGTEITLSVEVESGWVFQSWTVTDASSNPIEVTENKFTMPAGDVTVVANYTESVAPDAVLKLSANGVVTSNTYKVGETVKLPETIVNDCVKMFVGWSADANCTTAPEYAPGADFELTATEHTLYAVYASGTTGETVTIKHNVPTTGTSTNMTGNNDANKFFGLDAAAWSVVAAKGGASNNVGINKDGTIRLYYAAAGGNTLTVTAPSKVATIKLTYNGTYTNAWVKVNGNKVTPTDGVYTIDAETFVIGNANTTNVQVHIKNIAVTLAGALADFSTTCSGALAAPTFSVAEGEYTEAKSITLSAAEGTIYYTLDGTTPTSASDVYSEAIVLDECGEFTIKAIAIGTESESPVASATYTLALPIPANDAENPYTGTEAIEVYNGGCYDGSTLVYVTGTVQEVEYSSSYGNYEITFADGFQCYRLQETATEKFTEDKIGAGDVIVACGKLDKYGSKYQLAQGCYLVKHTPSVKAEAELAWNPKTVTITVGEAFTAPTLVNPYSVAGITYETSNDAVATVSAEGVIALVDDAVGTVTITATFAGDATYKPAEVTCTIKVKPVQEDCEGSDDFETLEVNNGYATRTTTAGWKATNAAVAELEGYNYIIINGKTSTVGTITSPVLNGGLGSIKIRYANTYSESNGVSFRLDIKQNGEVVETYTITHKTGVTQNTVYTETIENINVDGDFQMVFTNLSPSNSTSNKDRVSIGRLCWTGYVAPILVTPSVEKGIFSVADGKFVQFSTGNLQYEVETNTWSFAENQYDYVGEANINVGNPNYEGKIDMFGWSADGKFGVNPSNKNEDYNGDFVDWGTLVNEADWYTLSADEWKYLLNTRANAANLKQIAKVDGVVGIMLFPDAWTMPADVNVAAAYDDYFKVNIYNYTLEQWAKLEAAGAVFLPAAGRRTGGWGNTTISPHMVGVIELDSDGHYKYYDNGNIYCYYWTSTINESTKDVSYLHNIQALGGDKYTIGTGAVWGEKGRYGQSVRLVKAIEPDYKREVRQGYYGTICLENGGQMIGASRFELSYYNEAQGLLYMDEADDATMVAGNPYIFLPNEGADTLYVFYDETTDTAKTVNGLVGSFDSKLLDADGTNYIMKDNKIKKVVGEYASVGANKAYIKLGSVDKNEPAPVPGRRRVAIGQAPQVATGMESVDASAQPVKMIIDGQLYILRGEKMYDAQGKLVK